jgi:hypothetical protein
MVNNYVGEVCANCRCLISTDEVFYCGNCDEQYDTEEEAEECCSDKI